MAIRGRFGRTVVVDVHAPPTPERRGWWPLAAVGGAICVAMSGWLACALPAAATLAVSGSALPAALKVSTQFWLLGHGAPAVIGQTRISVVPLGVTLLVWLLGYWAAGIAGRSAPAWGKPWMSPAAVGGTFAAAYAASVSAGAALAGLLTPRVLIGAAAIGVVAGAIGACRGTGWNPFDLLPGWTRSLPAAAAAGQLVVLAAAAGLTCMALLLAKDSIAGLTDRLDPGVPGALALAAIQLAYLPNLIVWAASWTMGAGFSLDVSSAITPGGSNVGLLPGVPFLAAAPASGVGWWWLAVGGLAGGLVAYLVVAARPKARWDESALVGGLSGVASGLIVAGWCTLASGALGSGRLAWVGARYPELVVLAPTCMGLAGIVVGLATGLLRRTPVPDEGG